VECDLGHVRGADLGTVGALARAAVNTRRSGARLRVVNVPPELQDLIALAGLTGVLLGRDRRQAKQGEQPLRVEERREPDDPPL
jgi:anti-anti-sigma regulatory factor